MTIRTLKRDDSLHIANLWSMVLAAAVSCCYFDNFSVLYAGSQAGHLLLTPVLLADFIFESLFETVASQHFGAMFLILWITYFAILGVFSHHLVIKDHQPADLKNWYEKKFNKT
jgi:hypothetical protein